MLAPELDAEDPRARMLAAAEAVLCEQGPAAITVAAVCARAGVSRSGFYRAFADHEDCVLALFDELAERLETRLLAAYRAQECWVDGVRAALATMLEFLQESPERARFLVTERAGDAPLLARRSRLLFELARAFDAHRPAGQRAAQRPPFGSEAPIAAAAAIVRARLLEDPFPDLADLSRPLMAVMVMPFLGDEAAREELARHAPSSRRRGARGPAEFALRARSRQVLALIAQSPGLTNRAIARAAGGIDEGQLSRLLSRLLARGLVVNRAHAGSRVAAKSWQITPLGRRALAEPPLRSLPPR